MGGFLPLCGPLRLFRAHWSAIVCSAVLLLDHCGKITPSLRKREPKDIHKNPLPTFIIQLIQQVLKIRCQRQSHNNHCRLNMMTYIKDKFTST